MLHFRSSKILLPLLLVLSCKKDPPPPEPEPPCMEDGLPCLTTTGSNMFACKVDGVPWIAETPFSIGGPIPLYGEFNETIGELWLVAIRKIPEQGIYQVIRIYVENNVFSTGQFNIDGVNIDNEETLGYEDLNAQSPCNKYYHDSLSPGLVEICHLDTSDKIISGKFGMTVHNLNCSTVNIEITKGRFDLKYQY